MALDITNPQTITSGEGTGFAKVIPLEKFQAADTKNLIDHQWDKFQLEKQKQEKLKSNLASLPKAVVAKEEKNRKEIADDYNSFLDFSVNLAAQGIDLTSNPEFMKREQELKQKVALDEMMAKKLGEYKSELEKNGTKYDQDLFDQRLKEYNEAATMEDRVAAMNKPWLLENIEPLDGLKEFFPEVKGYGAVTNDQANQGAKLFYMEKKPIMEAAIERGIYKDEEDALAKIAEAIKLLAPYKNPPKSGGGSPTINIGGNASRVGMALATYDPSAAFNYENETNVVKFLDENNKQLPPQQLTDNSGKEVYMQVEKLVKKNQGGGWSIVGKRAKRLTTDQFEAAKKQSGFDPDDYELDSSTGEYISVNETEPIEIALKKGTSNYDLLSNAAGVDLFKMIQDRDEKTIGTRDPYGRSQKESGKSNQAKTGLKPTGNL